MSTKRTRGWCFTLNNYRESEIERLDEKLPDDKLVRYAIYGYETAPETQTPHLQGYIEMKDPKNMAYMKKNYAQRAHWESRKGTPQEASDYCKKENDFRVFGEMPEGRGHRSDLDEIAEEIANGRWVSDIALEKPVMYHQYGRTMNYLEDLRLRKIFRTEMTQGIWVWGPTGVGKSHFALEDFNPATHYLYPNDGEWWDGYVQQETVVINDFRGEIPYGTMLNMVDCWPFVVRRRNREPMPFNSKTVIITSSIRPELIYRKRVAEDKIEQLLRRFDIIHMAERYDGSSSSSSSSTEEPEEPEDNLSIPDDYDYGDIDDINDISDIINNR